MQVYLREVPTISSKGLLLLPLEDAKLSPVDILDIAKIAFSTLTRDGHESRAFDITGPEALSMAEIASAIREAINKPVRYQNVSPDDRRRAMLAAGLPPYSVDALDEQAAERRRHPQSGVELGAHELFGVKPTTFAEFARLHAVNFRGETQAIA